MDLYGLITCPERLRSLLVDSIRSLGFTPSRIARDVWMRLRDDKSGNDYICTHVDDFKVVARDVKKSIDYNRGAFLVKEHGPRKYYLGNDYSYHEAQDIWTYGGETYIKESYGIHTVPNNGPPSRSRYITASGVSRT